MDEPQLLVHPVVWGRGKKVFDDQNHAALEKGVALLRYQPKKG
ncbi:hypothetical protein [Deinococcus metallilatus]|uniref:Uncharacterized protein n=1 Tax=Deinococcus metallilatus TaxID=1211322 RepID=A0ABR6MWT5_9DEIO|nr:hypothetical protein [Deinococcus metallilatus]MBB5295706.1 hypothetical protein [Deinococcus metallilatus]